MQYERLEEDILHPVFDNQTKNKYLYNGKEFVDDLGLGWNDYGARYYDSSIGRFTGVDPLSVEYAHVTTYNYAENEPIAHIDLWGLQKELAPMSNQGTRSERLEYINASQDVILEPILKLFSAVRKTQVGQFMDGVVNTTMAAFVDVGSIAIFPLINQTGVFIEEGAHEGPAYNDENNILPNTYTLDKDWNLVPQESMDAMNSTESEKRGKEIMKNTIKVLTTVVGGPKETLVEKGATIVTKSVINKAAEKLLEVEQP